MWAGHAVIIGHRTVPFLGRVEARTESFVLATVRRANGNITLSQQSCEIRLGNPAGVRLTLNKGAAARLPPVELSFEHGRDGYWHEGPSSTRWSREDVDGDGHPGLTINVDAPVCGGQLYVGLETTEISRGNFGPDGSLRGEMKARVKQDIIDSAGACLSVLARGAEDRSNGAFAYVKVAPDTTCAALSPESWPVTAEPR